MALRLAALAWLVPMWQSPTLTIASVRLSASLRSIVAIWILANCVGCSSLGLSLFPAGSFLTEQAERVLNASPRRPQLPRELDQGVLRVHYLQPGDVLLIEPIELDSDVRLPADQRVMVDGSLDLGEYGRVIVAGMTIEDSETLIERTIREAGGETTQVNVRLLEPVHRYYVLGEVSSPGAYPLDGHESVLDGILAAGGLTSAASPCKILLARPTLPNSCRVVLPVCYREITQLGDTTTNYQLQPGDRIFVASRGWCEELKFWQADQTCERCNACQYPCPDPNVVEYSNPVTRLVLPNAAGEAIDADSASPSSEVTPDVDTSPLESPEVLPPALSTPQPVETSPQPTIDGELDLEF